MFRVQVNYARVTERVGEFYVRMPRDVVLYLAPAAVFMADFLATRTDRQQPGQRIDVCMGCLKLFAVARFADLCSGETALCTQPQKIEEGAEQHGRKQGKAMGQQVYWQANPGHQQHPGTNQAQYRAGDPGDGAEENPRRNDHEIQPHAVHHILRQSDENERINVEDGQLRNCKAVHVREWVRAGVMEPGQRCKYRCCAQGK